MSYNDIETHLRAVATTIINNYMYCDVATAIALIAEKKGLGILCSVSSLQPIEETGLSLYTQEMRIIENEVSYLRDITYKRNNNAPSIYLVSEEEVDAISICVPVTLPIPPSKYSKLVLENMEPLLLDKPVFCVVIAPNGDWQAYEKE